MPKFFALLFIAFLFFSCSEETETTSTEMEKEQNQQTFADLQQCLRNAKELEDPDKCLSGFESIIAELSPEQTDQLAWDLYQALTFVGGSKDISDMYTMDTEKESKKLKKFGLHVDSEEGMPFYCVNWNYISEKLVDKTGPATKSFLEYRTKHYDKISYDAGLSLSFEELAKRLADAENVLTMGESPFTEYLLDEMSYETSWFINGLDNTPSYDWETRLLYDEARSAGEWLIKNGGPVISKVIEEYHGFIGEQNDKHTDDVWEKFSPEIVRKRLEVHYSVPTGKQ